MDDRQFREFDPKNGDLVQRKPETIIGTDRFGVFTEDGWIPLSKIANLDRPVRKVEIGSIMRTHNGLFKGPVVGIRQDLYEACIDDEFSGLFVSKLYELEFAD